VGSNRRTKSLNWSERAQFMSIVCTGSHSSFRSFYSCIRITYVKSRDNANTCRPTASTDAIPTSQNTCLGQSLSCCSVVSHSGPPPRTSPQGRFQEHPFVLIYHTIRNQLPQDLCSVVHDLERHLDISRGGGVGEHVLYSPPRWWRNDFRF
jgi:hypothetical protein